MGGKITLYATIHILDWVVVEETPHEVCLGGSENRSVGSVGVNRSYPRGLTLQKHYWTRLTWVTHGTWTVNTTPRVLQVGQGCVC